MELDHPLRGPEVPDTKAAEAKTEHLDHGMVKNMVNIGDSTRW